MKKQLKGAALELPLGLTRPGPCEPKFWKKWPPIQLFLLHVFLQSIINLHWLFNLSHINTHFGIFLRHACLSYISWYMLGSMSLTFLPIFAKQRGKRTRWYTEKCDLLSETTFLPYFMIVWCVFFYQSVCFFTNGVCHVFHQNIMFLFFLYMYYKKCW